MQLVKLDRERSDPTRPYVCLKHPSDHANRQGKDHYTHSAG